MNQLPPVFMEKMKSLLGEDFPAFKQTYHEAPIRSLRVNTLKVSKEKFLELVPFQLDPIPWCAEGFYYNHDIDRPGKHVYHAAGLYYIQEASAMSPAEALQPQPGEKILDLCAAPGGKTTQIAAKMNGEGILVANEVDAKRIKALVENLERCGVTNAVVLNEYPEHLAPRFTDFFDRILVDAPCSGEGMFRKDPAVCERWSLRAVEKCATLQLDILYSAAQMLKVGGRLVYSTCTFNPVENEQVIATFLTNHPEFRLLPVPKQTHYQSGNPVWIPSPHNEVAKTARLWPHRLRGEGHFVAVLEKTDGEVRKQKIGKFPPVHRDAKQLWSSFQKENLTTELPEGTFTLYGEHLYFVPDQLPSLRGLRVERPGRYLGQAKKRHFLPSHALALSLKPSSVKQVINFSSDQPELSLYLQGESLPFSGKGWTIITVDGFPLGWGKASNGLLKNHYPKKLRWDK